MYEMYIHNLFYYTYIIKDKLLYYINISKIL